ncbi:MAG: hypothetical protein H0U90_11315 [Actinobacteria bacterium]|nr:hypothetical protein [Actinomycetota bacterium]
MRKTLVFTLLAGAAGAAIWRRAAGSPREQVQLLFDDGSSIALDAGREEADRLLPLARDVLSAARSGT